ncbi:hypothetical protein HDV05_000577, partial [Chytridiales sp. JEL 0842]
AMGQTWRLNPSPTLNPGRPQDWGYTASLLMPGPNLKPTFWVPSSPTTPPFSLAF